jgi:hypothetical protein
MTPAEVIAGLLGGVRKCAFCASPATVRGRTLAEKGLPACDGHADRLRDRVEMRWASAVRAAALVLEGVEPAEVAL